MDNMLEELRLFVVGLAMLCPPLLGLVVLALPTRAIPKKWQLGYWVSGLTVLIVICYRIAFAAGPHPAGITSVVFVFVATPLVIGLTAVLLIRLMRACRARPGPDAQGSHGA